MPDKDTENEAPEDETVYTPPAHRIEKIGDAWHTVVERVSDGGPGPDGQPATVDERPSTDGTPAEPEDDGAKRKSSRHSSDDA